MKNGHSIISHYKEKMCNVFILFDCISLLVLFLPAFLSTKSLCFMTEPHVCEQLASSCSVKWNVRQLNQRLLISSPMP